MNPTERSKLNEMIRENEVVDNTQNIRDKKHSQFIKSDIYAYMELVNKYPNCQHKKFFKQSCLNKCSFIFNNYTDIYNKLVKNEVDVVLLLQFVDILKEIEDSKLDQHEASFKVGKILKEMYVDTALRKEQKNKGKKSDSEKPKTGKNVSYADFKKENN
jgi:hypothetical protein